MELLPTIYHHKSGRSAGYSFGANSLMVNDIKPIDKNNELFKFADDMTLDTSSIKVNNIVKWSESNRIPLNVNKI